MEIRSIKQHKKGQREVSFGTMLLLVLGVMGLILVGLGFWKGWGFFEKAWDIPPGAAQQMSTKCKTYIQQDQESMYCTDFTEVIDNRYVSCNYVHRKLSPTFEQGDNLKTTCNSKYKKAWEGKCRELAMSKGSKANKVGVEGHGCGQVSVSAYKLSGSGGSCSQNKAKINKIAQSGNWYFTLEKCNEAKSISGSGGTSNTVQYYKCDSNNNCVMVSKSNSQLTQTQVNNANDKWTASNCNKKC